MNTSKTGKTMFHAVTIAASLAVAAGLLAVYASQAYGDANYANKGNGTKSYGNHGDWIKAMIVKDIREHREMRWTGLTTDSHSLVPGVKILGVTEKSNDTITVTLGHVTKPDATGEITIDSSAVNDNVTLSAVGFNSHKDYHAHLDGSTVVNSGWSGTTSVDIKMVGKDSVFDYHFIRVVAVEATGTQQ